MLRVKDQVIALEKQFYDNMRGKESAYQPVKVNKCTVLLPQALFVKGKGKKSKMHLKAEVTHQALCAGLIRQAAFAISNGVVHSLIFNKLIPSDMKMTFTELVLALSVVADMTENFGEEDLNVDAVFEFQASLVNSDGSLLKSPMSLRKNLEALLRSEVATDLNNKLNAVIWSMRPFLKLLDIIEMGHFAPTAGRFHHHIEDEFIIAQSSQLGLDMRHLIGTACSSAPYHGAGDLVDQFALGMCGGVLHEDIPRTLEAFEALKESDISTEQIKALSQAVSVEDMMRAGISLQALEAAGVEVNSAYKSQENACQAMFQLAEIAPYYARFRTAMRSGADIETAWRYLLYVERCFEGQLNLSWENLGAHFHEYQDSLLSNQMLLHLTDEECYGTYMSTSMIAFINARHSIESNTMPTLDQMAQINGLHSNVKAYLLRCMKHDLDHTPEHLKQCQVFINTGSVTVPELQASGYTYEFSSPAVSPVQIGGSSEERDSGDEPLGADRLQAEAAVAEEAEVTNVMMKILQEVEVAAAESEAAERATVEIQRHYRGHAARTEAAQETERKTSSSATRIQAAFRGRTARTAVAQTRTESAAASVIQHHYRGHAAQTVAAKRRAAEAVSDEMVEAVIENLLSELPKEAGNAQASAESQGLAGGQPPAETAAVEIQRHYRGYAARTAVAQTRTESAAESEAAERATVEIQRHYRGHAAQTVAAKRRAAEAVSDEMVEAVIENLLSELPKAPRNAQASAESQGLAVGQPPAETTIPTARSQPAAPEYTSGVDELAAQQSQAAGEAKPDLAAALEIQHHYRGHAARAPAPKAGTGFQQQQPEARAQTKQAQTVLLEGDRVDTHAASATPAAAKAQTELAAGINATSTVAAAAPAVQTEIEAQPRVFGLSEDPVVDALDAQTRAPGDFSPAGDETPATVETTTAQKSFVRRNAAAIITTVLGFAAAIVGGFLQAGVLTLKGTFLASLATTVTTGLKAAGTSLVGLFASTGTTTAATIVSVSLAALATGLAVSAIIGLAIWGISRRGSKSHEETEISKSTEDAALSGTFNASGEADTIAPIADGARPAAEESPSP